MADIIQLLPDAIANQIAAGEVIQRPASVVKELIENSIDAGSTSIKVIIKDAGKTLIQIVDNGSGMSETDARMSFERHATSKIKKANDLFSIRTMGFRGEAMASIGAIAQVELRTRRHGVDLGTRLLVEGSQVQKQEPCQCGEGTSISVKNLFYNVPARRNFLKSNPVEMRHIVDEFQRVALAHPALFFSLHHNGNEVFHLNAGNQRQRIVGILGNSANKKLVPIEEETGDIDIRGFIGKPEFAKKVRGEQFFFVNNRFIKSPYLNHAVMAAYEELIPDGTYPLYVLFFEVDPAKIDINVHPTKQEIKFEDEKLIYNYLKVCARHALGQNSITPTLDFNRDSSIEQLHRPIVDVPREEVQTLRSGGGSSSKSSGGSYQKSVSQREKNNLLNWEKLYDGLGEVEPSGEGLEEIISEDENEGKEGMTIQSRINQEAPIDDASKSFSKVQKMPYQLHQSFIISQIKSGFLLIDQQAAHERILYERYLRSMQSQKAAIQKELFPKTIEVSPGDAIVLLQLLPDINALGFDIQEFGNDTFIVHGTPADVPVLNPQKVIETILDEYQSNLDVTGNIQEAMAKSMAKSTSLKRGKELSPEEMQALINQLFTCEMPSHSPFGRKCILTYDLDDLIKEFTV